MTGMTRHTQRSGYTTTMIGISLAGLVLLTLPTVALLVRALEARDVLGTSRTQETLVDALRLSVMTSIVAMVCAVVLGTPIAWVLSRARFPGVRLLDALVDLPIILPPAVAGVALLAAFGRRGLVGEPLDRLGITIGFSTVAVVIAQIFVAAPFYIRSAKAGFARIDPALEESAADLGAGPWRVFGRVTLPLSRGSLVAGAVLAWARALGEFGATIMFAGNREGVTQTMPLAIYERFGAGDLPTALVLSAILLAASVAFLVVVRILGEPDRSDRHLR